MLDMGPHEQSIARQAAQAGLPLPDRIQNAPELTLGLGLYLGAFFELDSERSHAFGPTSIPFTSIVNYARAFDFDDEQAEDLVYYIRKMDEVNLKRVAEKQKTK